jgi:hypothetical protein
MSDLLNSASLVLIPSGYKEDVVYSAVPTDGSGDLSFTRASNGTRVNSAGLVEVVSWNLIEQSETIGVSPWAIQNCSVTGNTTTAPNGTLTAETLTEDTTTSRKLLYQNPTIVANQEITLTIYVKKNTLQYIRLVANDLAENFRWFGAQFNLTALTYTSATGSNGNATFTSASITDAGNGWYRISVSGTINATTLVFGILTSDGTAFSSSDDRGGNVYLGTGKTAYIWGAQLNIGSTAKPYFPTTDRLNVPRLTYQNGGGGCPSLLLEKQSTNLLTYSEDFTNATYTKIGVTATGNTTTSPDGTTNADSILEIATGGTHESWQRASMTSGQLYTQSCFLKANGRNRVVMQIFDNATQYASAIYDLSTGVVVASVGTATIQSMGNGWYRCTITGTSPATGSGYCVLGLCENTYTNSAVMPSYSGDASKGVYWWGFQLENSSYPTSYISTTSASATRVQDLTSVPQGTIANFGTGAFCVFLDVNYAKLATTGSIALLGNRQSATSWWRIYSNGSVFRFEVNGSNGFTSEIFINSGTLTSRTKIAVNRNGNDLKIYVNGSSVFSQTSAAWASDFTTANTAVELNAWGGGLYDVTTTEYNETIFFKQSLTNSELASLTTI